MFEIEMSEMFGLRIEKGLMWVESDQRIIFESKYDLLYYANNILSKMLTHIMVLLIEYNQRFLNSKLIFQL